jgi:uncharacterized YkwD family protein
MKKRIIALTIATFSVLSVGCAPQDQQSQRDQQNQQNQEQTQRNEKSQNNKQQAIGGVESSVYQMGDIQRVKITSDKANVRTGVSNNTPVLQTQNKNSTLDVLNKVGDFYAVQLPNNQIGFVPQEDCKAIVAEDKEPAAPPSPQGTAPQGTTTPQGPTTPKTPTAPTNTGSLNAAEQQMVKLVNEARAQNNLPALKVDTALANVARTKSQDMMDNNYFSHNSPKYGSPFDMMKSFGIKYVQAGENIAGNQTVVAAHNALMNSPGHRKNILSPDFTHIGIGVTKGGTYGNMFTQMFVSKPQ